MQASHAYKEPHSGPQTAICQKSLADSQEKLFNFQKHLFQLKIKRKYEFNQIGSADKIPVLPHITVSRYQS